MNNLNIFLFLSIIVQSSIGISYNTPKLCPNATWNLSAMTFASQSVIGSAPYAIFVNNKNTVYTLNRDNGTLLVWFNQTNLVRKKIAGNASALLTIFVSDNDEIFVDNGDLFNRVDKYTLNSTDNETIVYVCKSCFGLFIDRLNNFYCALANSNQVIRKSLNRTDSSWSVVAGTGSWGLAPDRLDIPRGIFVDTDLNLYVSDFNNNRIQLFPFGQLNGTTVAGNGSLTYTIELNGPTSVILDADRYLFIVDSLNHRIIGSGPDGFRCIAACNGTGLGASGMQYPRTMSFDNDGNLFISDQLGKRIQKFILISNTCKQSYSQLFFFLLFLFSRW